MHPMVRLFTSHCRRSAKYEPNMSGCQGDARQRLPQRSGKGCLRIRLLKNWAVWKTAVDARRSIACREHERHAPACQHLRDGKNLLTGYVDVEHGRIDFRIAGQLKSVANP